jgi:hypothetical protein
MKHYGDTDTVLTLNVMFQYYDREKRLVRMQALINRYYLISQRLDNLAKFFLSVSPIHYDHCVIFVVALSYLYSMTFVVIVV